MLAIDKHLIPFTGTDRHNDSFVISGRPKGGTSQFETYATMQVVTEEQLHTMAVMGFTGSVMVSMMASSGAQYAGLDYGINAFGDIGMGNNDFDASGFDFGG